MTVRDMTYENEKILFSNKAFYTQNTKGREKYIPPCDIRTEFQRDRDRITHSKSFRRLMHKTQVFLSPEADHYRTRLTHTLEVSQIARTIARALRLNEDLCEAIALGHDLGHTPFGHAGERVLQRCFNKNFTHYNQSLRVVEKLERLNLTYEVRDGIVNHTNGIAETLEGRIIKFADKIAYINHDIDDACRAEIICKEDIPHEICLILGNSHGDRINKMVNSILTASSKLDDICMESDIEESTQELYDFLWKNVYSNPVAKGEEGKAELLLEQLFNYFIDNPQYMPSEYCEIMINEFKERAVCDYISGMTDRYAMNLYTELFIPKLWNGRKAVTQ